MATYRCTVLAVDDTVEPQRFEVLADNRLLHQMIAHRCAAIPVGCRGGGCGVCRVRILDGTYTTRRMSRRHVSQADEADGVALACRVIPTSDITVQCAPLDVATLSSA
jgi:ferredoxin